MAFSALGAALRRRPAAGLAKHGAAALSRLIQVDHCREFRATASKSSGDQALAVAKSLNAKLFIGGEFVDAASGKTFDSIDPRTEKPIVSLAEGDAADVDRAVDAARKAFDEGAWPRMTAKARGRVLYKLADLMEAHAEELALLETLDNGKPIFFSRAADIPLAIDHFRYYAGWADKIQGKTIPCDSAHFAYTLHEPLGAVGQIVPWNFSLLMATWKLAPALACGNTVVIKVAEQTPLTALKLAELAAEAGLPPGVLNIITGFGETAGAALARHKKVDKVAFTGSTEVGRLVGKAAAENLKPCTLELGGKSPAIVWKDVDVDKAVEDTHFALFFNHGQCCAAGSRLYVHEDIYDEFVEKSAQRAVGRKVGDPFGDVEQGPQVDAAQFSKIMSYITLGKEQGARMVAGGGRHGSQGYYVEPTVFADVGDDMAIARDEIFGPVMSIMKFSTMDEVLRRANDTPYGLAAGVFSQDIDVVNQLTRGLKSGTVWVNTYNVYDSAVPFGGYKASGIGRDKGEYALENYTQVKAVYQALRGTPGWL